MSVAFFLWQRQLFGILLWLLYMELTKVDGLQSTKDSMKPKEFVFRKASMDAYVKFRGE